MDAGKLVGKLYDAILPQYKDPEAPESLHSLNVLCVRLVFCMYTEDAGIFGKWQFHDYLEQFKPKEMHRKLGELFRVLDMDEEKRQEYDKYMDEDLSAFPYVNGGLFSDDVEIPRFNDEIADILLNEACPFDWYRISPTIFGAAFESTLNPDTRRTGGMHYTSLENIDKVIKPLFLDQLENELEGIFELKTPNIRDRQLSAFQKKLSELTFLDPACGSGNFLTATYIALRKWKISAHFSWLVVRCRKARKYAISEQFTKVRLSCFLLSFCTLSGQVADKNILTYPCTYMLKAMIQIITADKVTLKFFMFRLWICRYK